MKELTTYEAESLIVQNMEQEYLNSEQYQKILNVIFGEGKYCVIRLQESETVTLTYGEIFERVSEGETFSDIGVNEWYLAEGGDKNEKTTLTKKKASYFMGEAEFNARKNKN